MLWAFQLVPIRKIWVCGKRSFWSQPLRTKVQWRKDPKIIECSTWKSVEFIWWQIGVVHLEIPFRAIHPHPVGLAFSPQGGVSAYFDLVIWPSQVISSPYMQSYHDRRGDLYGSQAVLFCSWIGFYRKRESEAWRIKSALYGHLSAILSTNALTSSQCLFTRFWAGMFFVMLLASIKRDSRIFLVITLPISSSPSSSAASCSKLESIRHIRQFILDQIIRTRQGIDGQFLDEATESSE